MYTLLSEPEEVVTLILALEAGLGIESYMCAPQKRLHGSVLPTKGCRAQVKYNLLGQIILSVWGIELHK